MLHYFRSLLLTTFWHYYAIYSGWIVGSMYIMYMNMYKYTSLQWRAHISIKVQNLLWRNHNWDSTYWALMVEYYILLTVSCLCSISISSANECLHGPTKYIWWWRIVGQSDEECSETSWVKKEEHVENQKVFLDPNQYNFFFHVPPFSPGHLLESNMHKK